MPGEDGGQNIVPEVAGGQRPLQPQLQKRGPQRMGRIFGTLPRLCPLDRCGTPTDPPREKWDRQGRAPGRGLLGWTRGPRHLAGTEGRRLETAIATPIPRTERRQNAGRTREERGQTADRTRTERRQNADRATDQIEARGLPSCYRASTDKEGMDPPCLGGTPTTSEQNPNRAWIGPTL